MKDTDAPTPVHLVDYAPPEWLVERVDLTFRLAPGTTRVTARIAFAPNPARPGRHALKLDGERLRLIGARIDGSVLPEGAIRLTDRGLTVPAEHLPEAGFLWQAEVEIAPESNTAL
jgi:aminopeptidase N